MVICAIESEQHGGEGWRSDCRRKHGIPQCHTAKTCSLLSGWKVRLLPWDCWSGNRNIDGARGGWG